MKTFNPCVIYSRLRFAVSPMKDSFALRFYTACTLFMKGHEWYDNGEACARAIEAVAEVVHMFLP
ncbi:hypothetical protein KNN17_20965 [Arthrobacter bambusae]|uniref:hypothetical protein n=1 Tax=Arthrobacter bambusae TaxID=1338426 RepID=UPI001F509031|nr:hypothetical protein [Arthrobacter bambusae]MCI0144035.1 hypothetical protein [Arthrobacter bambusae]